MEESLMRIIRGISKLWANEMRLAAASVGVPDSYRMILAFLLRCPGASQKELAAHCGITTASVSQTVKEMALRGYLRKEPDEKDQRCVKLYLTGKGEECAKRILEKITRAEEAVTRMLTREGELELRRRLEDLTRILEKELPECGII